MCLLLAALLSMGADCGGGCPPVQLPLPMTDIRAKELDPTLVEGIGVSTTLVSGDCRPMPLRRVQECGMQPNPQCLNGRRSMRILIVPTNISISKPAECGGGFSVADLAAHAIVDARSSEGGELAAPLAAGRYALYIAKDDQCAICGLPDGGSACLVDVPRDSIVAKDLVFDEAAH